MASLRIKDNSYLLDWRDATGTRHRDPIGRVGVLTEKQAQTILNVKEIELSTGARLLGLPHLRSNSVLFGRFARDYLAWHENEYPDSHARIRQIVRDYLLPRFEFDPLDMIEIKKAEEYKKDRRLAGAKSQTITKEVRTLKAIINRAVLLKVIDDNPIAAVDPPQKLDSKPHRFYEADELATIYEACCAIKNFGQADPTHAAIWRLYANTGMRRMEGLNLLRSWVGKAELKILSSEAKRTKSGKWRSIPLTDGAQIALSTLPRGGQYVVPRVTPPSLSRAFINDARRAGLDGSLHTLRHTYISHLVRAGVPLRTVQVYAGHSSVTVTEGYSYLMPGNVPKAVSELLL